MDFQKVIYYENFGKKIHFTTNVSIMQLRHFEVL